MQIKITVSHRGTEILAHCLTKIEQRDDVKHGWGDGETRTVTHRRQELHMAQPSSLVLSIKVKPMTIQYFHSQLHTQEKSLHVPAKWPGSQNICCSSIYKHPQMGYNLMPTQKNRWISCCIYIHIYIYTYIYKCCGKSFHMYGGDSLVAKLCPILSDPTDCSPPGFSVHGDFPGKNTGMGCHFIL